MNNLYLDFNIISEKIKFPGYLTFRSQYNHLGIETCINLENSIDYNISSPLKELPGFQIYNNQYKKYFYLKENISLTDIEGLEYKINNIEIITPDTNEKQAKCIIIGLNPNIEFKNTNINYLRNLPLTIKANSKNYNLKTYLTIIYNFNTAFNNILILGEPPHAIYPNLFNIKKYKEIENYSLKKELKNYYKNNQNIWSIKLDNIYIGNESYSNESFIGQFSLDYIPFLIPMELYRKYLSYYLDTYISDHICEQKGRPLYNKYAHSITGDKRQTFIFIYCKTNKIENITEFYNNIPEINFVNKELNKNFTFKGKELFIEEDDYLILMIMPDLFNKVTITFGKIFMEKYLFSFNYDKNIIGFYNDNFEYITKNNNKNKNNIINTNNIPIGAFFIIIIIIFLLGIIAFMFKFFRLKKIKNNNETIERELIDVNEDKL